MPDKSLRILIADHQHLLCDKIARRLNILGYLRVASVHSFRELLTLTHCSCEPFENFDILIINAELALAAGVDLYAFCLGNLQVRHALIHDISQPERPQILYMTQEQIIVLIRYPCEDNIRRFMRVVDPLTVDRHLVHSTDT